MNMYDKLGSLLNETLEAGAVKFVRMEAPVSDTDKQGAFTQSSSNNEQTEPHQSSEQFHEEQKAEQENKA